MNNNDFKIALDETGKGTFKLFENGAELGFMLISLSGNNVTIYHTEASKNLKDEFVTLNRGIGQKLIDSVVKYARVKSFKIIPQCPYVYNHFRQNSKEYKDIWNRGWDF